jgi:uncharacterized membrane protein YkvA (DUF1232 family)
MKDLVGLLPARATTMRRLRKDPHVPKRAKVAVVIAGLWVLSPIDLIPERLPVIGPLDDAVVVALALRYAARRVPRNDEHLKPSSGRQGDATAGKPEEGSMPRPAPRSFIQGIMRSWTSGRRLPSGPSAPGYGRR